MAFTYSDDLTTDINYVRFHTGDVTDGENFLSDGLITSLVATEGSKQKAVIAAIRHIIARLSTPNFRADWLQIDNEAARRGYEKFLAEKKKELGVGGLVSGVIHPYRADSAATEEPDFSGGRPSYYGEDDECLP